MQTHLWLTSQWVTDKPMFGVKNITGCTSNNNQKYVYVYKKNTNSTMDGLDFTEPGTWFNIKMSYQNRKSYCGDKTVERSSYLHKMPSLYWIGALLLIIFSMPNSLAIHYFSVLKNMLHEIPWRARNQAIYIDQKHQSKTTRQGQTTE